MRGRDIYLSPKVYPTMYILTHKQSKGISSITEYEKLSILRNWRNKTIAVNSFKYHTIKAIEFASEVQNRCRRDTRSR